MKKLFVCEVYLDGILNKNKNVVLRQVKILTKRRLKQVYGHIGYFDNNGLDICSNLLLEEIEKRIKLKSIIKKYNNITIRFSVIIKKNKMEVTILELLDDSFSMELNIKYGLPIKNHRAVYTIR